MKQEREKLDGDVRWIARSKSWNKFVRARTVQPRYPLKTIDLKALPFNKSDGT